MSVSNFLRTHRAHAEQAHRVFQAQGQRTCEYFSTVETGWRDARGRAFARQRQDPQAELIKNGQHALSLANDHLGAACDLADRNEAAIVSGRLALETADLERADSVQSVNQSAAWREASAIEATSSAHATERAKALLRGLRSPPC